MRLVCVDKYAPTARYYEAEYFDPETRAAQSTFIVTDFSPYILLEQKTQEAPDLNYEMDLGSESKVVSAFLDPVSHLWTEIKDFQVLLTFGELVAVTENATSKTWTASLINEVTLLIILPFIISISLLLFLQPSRYRSTREKALGESPSASFTTQLQSR